jgi:hypothetical protein
MEKDSMAAKQNLLKHILNNWVSACALLVKLIQDFSTPETLLFNFKHKIQQGREHLKVDSEFLV